LTTRNESVRKRGEDKLRPFLVMNHWNQRRNRNIRLSTRLRVCSSIAALYAVGRREEASSIVREGLERLKLPRTMFSELFLHLSLFLGFPAMLDGFETLLAVKPFPKARERTRPRGVSARSGGLAVLSRIYGKQTHRLLRRLDELHPDLSARIVEDAYGRIVSRDGLSLREREVVNVVALALGAYRRQLYSHLRGALRVGVRPQTLKAVLSSAERLTGRDLGFAEQILKELTT
jgi:alkylhydroperoxidase/carboxymuconolactone decarboxylase family protein YurZ